MNKTILCKLDADEKVDIGLCMTKRGAKILVSSVPHDVVEKVELFYICEACGKVYWDGSHYDRILSSTLQDIVV